MNDAVKIKSDVLNEGIDLHQLLQDVRDLLTWGQLNRDFSTEQNMICYYEGLIDAAERIEDILTSAPAVTETIIFTASKVGKRLPMPGFFFHYGPRLIRYF